MCKPASDGRKAAALEGSGLRVSVQELANNFETFLRRKSPGRNPRQGYADGDDFNFAAVMFRAIELAGYDVDLHEDPATGGPDFLCKGPLPFGVRQFVLEVTHLSRESVSKHSGLTDDPPDEMQFYKLVTTQVRTKAGKKAAQLANHQSPRVLAIGSFHECAEDVMGVDCAENLLITPKITIDGRQPSLESYSKEDLEDKGFFRKLASGGIEPCRRSISAILLVACRSDSCQVVGVLHPDPVVPFDYSLLPKVPFARLQCWPPEEDAPDVEWVVGTPDPKEYPYLPKIGRRKGQGRKGTF